MGAFDVIDDERFDWPLCRFEHESQLFLVPL